MQDRKNTVTNRKDIGIEMECFSNSIGIENTGKEIERTLVTS
jgi:hypothetical protein